MSHKIRIAILASGFGSNARSLIEQARKLPNIDVALALCDRANAEILQTVPFQYLGALSNRAREEKIFQLLEETKIDWIFLAGYMRILSPWFLARVREYHQDKNKILNIHPSLLPKYKGLDAYEQAFRLGDNEFGATVHFVDNEVDSGAIWVQEKFLWQGPRVLKQIMEHGKSIENRIYAEVLEKISRGVEYVAPN